MSKEQDSKDPLSFDSTSNVEDWIRPMEFYSEEYGNSDWMALDPSSVNTMLLQPLNDEAEELGEGKLQCIISMDMEIEDTKCHQLTCFDLFVGFDDHEIFSSQEDDEDENTGDKLAISE